MTPRVRWLTRRLLIAAAVLAVLTGVLIFTAVPLPVAFPPSMPPGLSSAFDEHLGEIDRQWLFLRARGSAVELIDIHGRQVSTVLDVASASGRREARVVSGCLSPDRNRLAVTYGFEALSPLPDAEQMIIVELSTGRNSPLPLLESPWRMTGSGRCLWWLDDNVVLIALHNDKDGKAFCIYDAATQQRGSVIEFDQIHFVLSVCPGSRNLAVISPSPTPRPFRILDTNGPRDPNADEMDLVRKYVQPFLGAADRIYDVQAAPREQLTTREVIDDRFVPWKIRFGWDTVWSTGSWSRFDFRLGPTVVHRCHKGVSFVEWDADLRLFFWREEDRESLAVGQFCMDESGRYRLWFEQDAGLRFDSEYIDKVPRRALTGP